MEKKLTKLLYRISRPCKAATALLAAVAVFVSLKSDCMAAQNATGYKEQVPLIPIPVLEIPGVDLNPQGVWVSASTGVIASIILTKTEVVGNTESKDILRAYNNQEVRFTGGKWDTPTAYRYFANGNYTVEVRNGLGDTASKTFSINNIDGTGPSVSLSVAPADEKRTEAVISVSASDTQSGLGSASYSYDGGKSYGGSSSYRVNANGTYTVYVRDNVGNVSSEKIAVNCIDKDAPVIKSVSCDKTGWVSSSKGVKVSVSASDALSGIAGYSFDGGNSFTSSSEYVVTSNGTVNVVVKDKAGNKASSEIKIGNIDTTAPSIETITKSVKGWSGTDVVIDVAATDGESGLAAEAFSFDGGKTYSSSTGKIVSSNGTFDICVKDAVGNVASKSFTVDNIDKNNPVIDSFSASDTWSNKSVTVTVNAHDDESGLAANAYSFNGGAYDSATSFKVSENGTYNVSVKDNVGNISSASVTVSTIDKSAPKISSISKDVSGWTGKSVTISVNASDSQSGLAGEAYSYDGGTNFTSSSSYTVSKNCDVSVVVRDAAGNTSSSSVNISNIDLKAPSVTSVLPSTTAWTNKPISITVSAKDSGSGLADKAYSFDGKSFTSNSSLQVSQNGTYNVTVSDAVGNLSSASVEVKNIDTNAPVIRSVDKSTEEWTPKELTISVNATDDESGLNTMAYSFDGGNRFSSTPYAVVKANGTYTVCVKDKAGNISSEQIVIANIGKSPSQIEKERLEAEKKAEEKARKEKEALEAKKEAERKKTEESKKIAEAQKKAAELEARKKDLEKLIDEIDTQKQKYESELSSLKSQLEDIKASLNNNPSAEERKKLTEQESMLEEQIKKLEESIIKLEDSKSECEKELNDDTLSYEEIIKNLEVYEKEFGKLEEDYRKYSDEYNTRYTELVSARENADKLAAKVEEEKADNLVYKMKKLVSAGGGTIEAVEMDDDGNYKKIAAKDYVSEDTDISDALSGNADESDAASAAAGDATDVSGTINSEETSKYSVLPVMGIVLLVTGVLLALSLNYVYIYDGKKIKGVTFARISLDKGKKTAVFKLSDKKLKKEGRYRIFVAPLYKPFVKNRRILIAIENKGKVLPLDEGRSFDYCLS